MKKLLLSFLFAACFLSLSAQCSLREVSLSQRVSASSLVIEGRVTAKQSYWDFDHNMIYTSHTIEVYKVFKGQNAPEYIEILTEGGTVGLDRISVEPSLELEPGETGVFTCIPVSRIQPGHRSGLPAYEAYASVQGFVKYDLETRTASDPFHVYTDIPGSLYGQLSPARYVSVKHFEINNNRTYTPSVNVTAISGFAPSTVTAGTGTQITITGTGFGATQGSGTVGFKNADDGGATYINPLASQYISWSSTQIVVEVPANAGTGTIQVTQGVTFTSASTLTVSYAHLNVDFDPGPGTTAYQTDHVDDNGSGGYTWRMNTGFDADASARASFMRAFDTWRCNTNVNWTIGATTSINDAVSDGTNVICFDNTAPLSAGILGVCYSYWSGCASGPNIIWYVNELDIIFDEGSNITPLTWEYGPAAPSGSEYDFETVAVHELGHGHQLGHVISPGAIMHYAISNGSSNRSLGVDDLAGGNFVQAKSIVANLCGPGAMTNYSCASPPVAAFSGSPTTVCAGGNVAFTDQSTNTPTSWSWTFTGGTPSSSSAQNPTVTYNTPGTYNVSLTATNASGNDTETLTGYITVNALPSVGASSNPVNGIVCSGDQVTLTGSGAVSYNWTGGVTDAVPFTPVSTTTYTVTGTDGNGCQNTTTALITVNNLPNVTASSNPVNGIVCSGDQVTLTGGGAVSYNWTGGVTDAVPFTPVSTTTYTVTGTDGNGCQNTATALITVNNLPNVTASSNPVNGIVCSGQQATLTGGGAVSYNWTGGVTDAVPFTPVSTTTYTVTGTDGNGCQNTATALITVNTCGGPTTTVPCGGTYNKKTQTISAVNVPGAVNYRFTFYDNVTLAQVGQRTQASRTLALKDVPGIFYATTYRITVAVDAGSGFGPESSNNCTITLGIPSTTLPCGVSYNSFSSYTAVFGPGGVTNFRFTFYDNVTLAQVAQRTQTSPYLYFNQVSGLQYGNTYRWTVAVEYPLSGGGSAFGPESSNSCTVTFNGPQTTVPCGYTYSLNGYSAATAVNGAVSYRFSFYQGLTLMAQRTQTSNYIYFNQVSGLTPSTSYTWRVEVGYNNGSGTVFGPPSNASCVINFGSSPLIPNPDEINTPPDAMHSQAPTGAYEYYNDAPLLVIPNPATDRITVSTNETIQVIYLYTITGQLVKTVPAAHELVVAELQPGTYVLVAQTEHGMKRTLVVKQ